MLPVGVKRRTEQQVGLIVKSQSFKGERYRGRAKSRRETGRRWSRIFLIECCLALSPAFLEIVSGLIGEKREKSAWIMFNAECSDNRVLFLPVVESTESAIALHLGERSVYHPRSAITTAAREGAMQILDRA